MQKLGQSNVGFQVSSDSAGLDTQLQGIYNVLSSRTSLNKLTTYTGTQLSMTVLTVINEHLVLMSVSKGQFETHIQSCPGDCWGW